MMLPGKESQAPLGGTEEREVNWKPSAYRASARYRLDTRQPEPYGVGRLS